MSTTIVLDFSIGDITYHVDAMKGVRKGRVKDIEVSVLPSTTTITYEIVFIQPKYGSTNADGDTLYADQAAAFVAYGNIVEAT